MSQTAFTSALLSPDAPVPPGITDPQGRLSVKRFNVYRNNVAVSLTEALVTGFPVIHKLVGDAFFKAMAGVFLRAHPPESAVLNRYGRQFPEFLSAFPPVAHLPYLADVARLELALRESYHAADHVPLAPERFAAIPPDDLADTYLTLAPSLILLRAAHPAFDIWRANTRTDMPQPRSGPQDIAVARLDYDPEPHLLGPGAYRFFSSLRAGKPLGIAAADAAAETPEFALSETLALAFATQLFAEDPAC